MHVIILAAGFGSRLGARTAARPKPALEVAGHTLLEYAITFARAAGAEKITVVTGFQREVSQPLAEKLGADEVLWNERFSDAGNIESLEVARQAGACAFGFLMMNADHIYRPTIAPLVGKAAEEATQVTAFVDHDRQLTADDMKARLDGDGRILAIDKNLDEWNAGYVGMTFVPRACVEDYFHTAENVRRERGDSIHVETILARMAGVEGARTLDISGHGWLEVDDDADLARAEAALAADPWY